MRRPVLLVCGVVVGVACTTQLTLPGGSSTGTPTGSATPTASGTPFFGDGQDPAPTITAPGTVINTCLGLISGSGSTLQWQGPFPASIRANALFLVLQVQDAFVTPSNGAVAVANLQEASSVGRAGMWSLVRAQAAAANSLTTALIDPLPVAFGTTAESGVYAEACLVPQYPTVNVPSGSSLAAAPWSAGSGGVVAFLASNAAIIDGSVTADSAGELGGITNAVGTAGTDSLFGSAGSAQGGGNADGGDVGFGGRGRVSNGGGGGSARYAGGGGGGAGGTGGPGASGCTADFTGSGEGGVPGVDLGLAGDARADRLFIGGGGGGGGSDGIDFPSTGGAGGGLVLVIARSLSGSGTISAKGAAGNDAVGNQVFMSCPLGGGAGGGAGGTILVWTSSNSSSVSLVATGGKGGSTASGSGAGGGGGGGRLLLPADLVVSTNLAGGPPGTNGNIGASAGHPGVRATPVPPGLGT